MSSISRVRDTLRHDRGGERVSKNIHEAIVSYLSWGSHDDLNLHTLNLVRFSRTDRPNSDVGGRVTVCSVILLFQVVYNIISAIIAIRVTNGKIKIKQTV